MSQTEISTSIDSLNNSLNETVNRLKGMIREQERLKQIEAEMKLEEERKKQEEEKRRQEEDIKRRKLELEQKFIQENAAAQEAARKQQQMAQNQPPKKVMVSQEIQTDFQQEILDHELALRIARESSGSLSPNALSKDQVSPVMLPRSLTQTKSNSGLPSKYEYLTKWKYSELRDTINTSCDIELLEACKAEFHRRLKVYHEWKARNQVNGDSLPQAALINGSQVNGHRAPACIMENAISSPLNGNNPFLTSSSNESRFFRIPFLRPSVILSRGQEKGWWFAHFQGQWIARQMELHPEKPPILLVAGKGTLTASLIIFSSFPSFILLLSFLRRKEGPRLPHIFLFHECPSYVPLLLSFNLSLTLFFLSELQVMRASHLLTLLSFSFFFFLYFLS